jgi:hypothetical protein
MAKKPAKKTKTNRQERCHWVIAKYPMSKWGKGYDEKLKKAAGRWSDGSGAEMWKGGKRDNEWEFVRESTAQSMLKKLRRVKLPGLSVKLINVCKRQKKK